jgi:hypothetical protein
VPHRWVELCWKPKGREILLRLLVAEKTMTHGGDPFDDAVKVCFRTQAQSVDYMVKSLTPNGERTS